MDRKSDEYYCWAIRLLGDTTLDPLGRLLERGQEKFRLLTSTAPYGQVYQIFLDASHPRLVNLRSSFPR